MSHSDVPKGWTVASIDDVATSSGGSTPSKSDPSFWTNGNIPWVSPKDMKTFDLRSSEDLVSERALARLTEIPENSVLLVVRSGILSRTLPVAVNTIPVTINQDMRAFIPEKNIEPRFIAWQLIANERNILDNCSKDGTTVASIEGPALSAFPLSIAPAAEQTRIVEKLEELLSDLDAGVAELKAAQVKLARYRQSLLKAAVEGALTAEWRAARAGAHPPPRAGEGRGGGAVGPPPPTPPPGWGGGRGGGRRAPIPTVPRTRGKGPKRNRRAVAAAHPHRTPRPLASQATRQVRRTVQSTAQGLAEEISRAGTTRHQ